MESNLRLKRSERRRLQKLSRKTQEVNVRNRCLILLKVAGGKSRRQAALEISVVPSTAWVTVNRFLREGEASLFDRRHENGERKVDADLEERIRNLLTRSPQEHGYGRPTWTLELIQRVLTALSGVTLSIGHLWRVLRRMGVRWGCPRPVVACPWKAAARLGRVAQLRRLAARRVAHEVVVFVDEVDLHLNPRMGRDWQLPGQQRVVVTPGQNEKRYLAGAYDHRGQRLTYVVSGAKNSWLFLDLLRALMRRYRGATRVHLILDNYVIHKSRVILAWLAARGRKIRLHFLPPYCPEENRIERLWLDLHSEVTRNHRCETMRELVEEVIWYLEHRFGARPAALREV